MLVYIYIYEFNAVTWIVILKKQGLFKSHDEMEAATDLFFCIVSCIKWIIKKKQMLDWDLSSVDISCLIDVVWLDVGATLKVQINMSLKRWSLSWLNDWESPAYVTRETSVFITRRHHEVKICVDESCI